MSPIETTYQRRLALSLLFYLVLLGCDRHSGGEPQVDGRLDEHCASTLVLNDIQNPKVVETHGVDFLIYPETIPAGYTGCRVMWLGNGHKLATTHHKHGEVTWIRGQEPKDVRPFFCVYEAGRLAPAASFNLKRCPESVTQATDGIRP